MEQNYNQILQEQTVGQMNNQIKENFIPNGLEKKSKNMYVLNLDGSRIFWLLSIILLLMTFVLLLGYWIGSDSTSYNQNNANTQTTVPANSAQIIQTQPAQERETITQNSNMQNESNNTERSANQTSENNSRQNTNVQQNETQNPRESVEENNTNTRVPLNSESVNTETRSQIATRMRRLSNTRGVDTHGSDKFLTIKKPYTIQIATHFSLRRAKHVKKQLQNLDHSAYIFSHEGANGRKFYKIRVGTFKDRNSAITYLATLKQTPYGKDGIIIHR